MSMNATSGFPETETVFELAGDWKTDVVNLIKKEIQLAKTEVSEKVSCIGRNSVFIAIGGVCALMALFIVFLGLGALVAYGLRAAGLSVGMSYFLGYCGLGLLLAIGGYLLIMKGIHAITSAGVAPEKTISSIRAMKGETPAEKALATPPARPKSSEQLKQEVEVTRTRIEKEVDEMRHRVTPRHIAKTAWAMSCEHPVRIAVVSAVTGLSSFFIFKWRMRSRVFRALRA